MAFKFIILVLPALALASIDVKISGTYIGYTKDVKVTYKGTDISIISEAERTTFKLNEINLKRGVNIHFGEIPDDVYVRSPTPWGDLYRNYSWQQVTRVLVPRSGEILNVTWLPTVVAWRTFENNSTKPATFNVGVTKSVSNTVSSSWSTEGELFVEEKINYEINIDVANIDRETSFSYNTSWGKNTQQSRNVTVGASSPMNITLQPGQTVVAQLEATRGIVQVNMVYIARLYGYVAIYYAHKYQGYNFWTLDIGSCMDSGGLSNQKISREVIDIEFYSDPKVIISDKQRQ